MESFSDYSLLRYPAGVNPKEQVDINIRDINSLKKEKFLTDQVIDFWLKYIQTEQLSLEIQETVHVYSSLFYTFLLRSGPNGPKGRRRWTRRKSLDIFQKEFLVFPVVVESHWLLVIVCYAEHSTRNIGESCSKYPRTEQGNGSATKDDEPPMILILDSYRAVKLSYSMIAATVRSFLSDEWKVRRGSDFKFNQENMPFVVPDLPQQSNLSDCGVYILQFFEGFFTKPPSVPLSIFFNASSNWIYTYTKNVETDKREHIYQTILSLLRSKQHQLFPNAYKLLPKNTTDLPVSENISQSGFMSLFSIDARTSMSESRKSETLKVVSDFFRNWMPNKALTNKSGHENQSQPSVVDFEGAQSALGVDSSKPLTNVTIRMADGSRFTIALNLSQPVSMIREFICYIRPTHASKIFSLMTSFPFLEINENMTIQDANLMNSVVTQNLKGDL